MFLFGVVGRVIVTEARAGRAGVDGRPTPQSKAAPDTCLSLDDTIRGCQVSTQVRWARESGALPPPDPKGLEPQPQLGDEGGEADGGSEVGEEGQARPRRVGLVEVSQQSN